MDTKCKTAKNQVRSSRKSPREVLIGKHEPYHGASRFSWKRFFTKDELGNYAILTWDYWRCLIVCFCVFAWLGHFLEIPYISFMSLFPGVVEPDYAALHEPWFYPYFVYGIGAVAMTLLLEPFKESIVRRRKTLWGGMLETFVYTTLLAAILETAIGLIINQPNAAGVYPFWDNSQLPLNILGQGWLVNDIVIGLVAVVYLWLLYPLIGYGLSRLSPKAANTLVVVMLVLFVVASVVGYTDAAQLVDAKMGT